MKTKIVWKWKQHLVHCSYNNNDTILLYYTLHWQWSYRTVVVSFTTIPAISNGVILQLSFSICWTFLRPLQPCPSEPKCWHKYRAVFTATAPPYCRRSCSNNKKTWKNPKKILTSQVEMAAPGQWMLRLQNVDLCDSCTQHNVAWLPMASFESESPKACSAVQKSVQSPSNPSNLSPTKIQSFPFAPNEWPTRMTFTLRLDLEPAIFASACHGVMHQSSHQPSLRLLESETRRSFAARILTTKRSVLHGPPSSMQCSYLVA